MSARPAAARPGELTIDQLAAEVGMTVRNVRAYASRGLLPPPRLVGRTGYYDQSHAARLRLIRDLLDRGYTLAAVENALRDRAAIASGHALELLNLLADPMGEQEEPEVVSVQALAARTGQEPDDDLVARLVELGLAERVDESQVRLLRPSLVYAGGQAIAMGLSREATLSMLPLLSEQLRPLAREFVARFRDELWRPFTEAGMPADEWPQVLERVQALLPVAAQSVLVVFRDSLTEAIDEALGEELHTILRDANTSA